MPRRVSTSATGASLLLLLTLPAAAQTASREEPLRLYAYALEHRPAMEALALIQPLLTGRGTVELRPGENTLVVRDSLSAITRIAPVLRRFDQPARRLAIEMLLVEARRAPFSPAVADEEIPPDLATRLKGVISFDGFRLLAKATLEVLEGQEVTYELGEGFAVSFRPGMDADARVRLHAFRVARSPARPDARPLFRGDLNLSLDRPTALGLAQTESSPTALVVVLTPRLAAEPKLLVRQEDRR